MMEIEEILDRVKKKIRPSKREEKEINDKGKELRGLLEKHLNLEIRLFGSVAKGTFLKGEHDLDMFVFFDKSIEKEKAAKKIFSTLDNLKIKYEKRYSEHPYAKIHYKGIDADIVPAYKIKKGEKIVSAVDRTPLHYKFVKQNLKEWQKDEVRLLKKFLKNFGIYGAEVGIKGFSGYLCELLIIKYGDFISLLKNSSSWRIPKKIYLEKRTGVKNFEDPFVLIDPTDKNRNVASPVSKDNLAKFIAISSSFLKNPSKNYFFIEMVGRNVVKNINLGKFIAVEFKTPNLVEDVRHGQLMRILKSLKRNLELKGYFISSSFIYENKGFSYIVISTPNDIPKKEITNGPYVWENAHVDRFLKKNRTAFINGERYFTIKENKTKIKDNIKEILSKYSFPSYFSTKWRIKDKFNKRLEERINIEKKRHYLTIRR